MERETEQSTSASKHVRKLGPNVSKLHPVQRIQLRLSMNTDKFRSKIIRESFWIVLESTRNAIQQGSTHCPTLTVRLPEYSSLLSTQLCSSAPKMDTTVFGSIAS